MTDTPAPYEQPTSRHDRDSVVPDRAADAIAARIGHATDIPYYLAERAVAALLLDDDARAALVAAADGTDLQPAATDPPAPVFSIEPDLADSLIDRARMTRARAIEVASGIAADLIETADAREHLEQDLRVDDLWSHAERLADRVANAEARALRASHRVDTLERDLDACRREYAKLARAAENLYDAAYRLTRYPSLRRHIDDALDRYNAVQADDDR